MIITQKQFPNYKKYEIMYEGRPLSMEVGKMAELCNAAVLVKYGDTTVLVTCTASARPKDGIDHRRRHPQEDRHDRVRGRSGSRERHVRGHRSGT